MTDISSGEPKRKALILIFAACAAAYVISQFMRASVAVIAPDIARDLQLDPSELGVLTGSFFLSFALMQIPVGVALDRYGARVTMLGLFAAVLAGAVLFAIGDDLIDLTLARVVMGIGCSVLLMGPFMVFGNWFPARIFASLSGWLISAGTIGALIATAPLAFIVAGIGWRGAFWGLTGVCLIVLLIIFIFIKDHPPEKAEQVATEGRETLGESLMGVGDVFRTKDMLKLLAIHMVGYSAMASILTLWGGPYLADVQGLDGPDRGLVLMGMSVAVIIGMSLWGSADRLMGSRKRPVLIGGTITVSVLATLIVFADGPLWLITLLLMMLGLNNGYSAIYIAHGRAIFPARLTGRGLTVLNMGNMGGVALLQMATGGIVELFGGGAGTASPVDAYRAVFAFLAILLVIALIIYARATDIPPETTQSQ